MDAYAASLERDEAVKAALNVRDVRGYTAILTGRAELALKAAGLSGTVHVQLWVTEADSCGLTIVRPGAAS